MIFDTDVLIWILRDNEKAVAIVQQDETRAVSVVSSMELLRGARDKQEMANIRKFLAGFDAIPISEEVSSRALMYMEQHALKTRMSPLDALIAATAMERQEVLCSGNAKHFRQIAGIRLHAFRM